mmetsp:Transcript_18435/g.56332  ORF Transcript_18435/g.56332 Transcript_18435/m.56332 type:complete len:206 (-) Transcript_18435:141-758(-)
MNTPSPGAHLQTNNIHGEKKTRIWVWVWAGFGLGWAVAPGAYLLVPTVTTPAAAAAALAFLLSDSVGMPLNTVTYFFMFSGISTRPPSAPSMAAIWRYSSSAAVVFSSATRVPFSSRFFTALSSLAYSFLYTSDCLSSFTVRPVFVLRFVERAPSMASAKSGSAVVMSSARLFTSSIDAQSTGVAAMASVPSVSSMFHAAKMRGR